MSISCSGNGLITTTPAASNAINRHTPSMAKPSRRLNTPLNSQVMKNHSFRLYVAESGRNIHEAPDFDGSSTEKIGTNGKHRNIEANTSNAILNRLKRYGVSGILSYDLLNTAYYLTTFLVVWFFVAPVPGRMGYLAAVERFLKVMAMVWAGSQVTKIMRAGGALALAPFVDRGLSWFTVKYGFETQGKAFMAIAGICFGLAFLLFLIVTLLWA